MAKARTVTLTILLSVAIASALYNFRGESPIADVISPKITGAGDSIMARGTKLQSLAERLSADSVTNWRIHNVAIGGGRVGKEILSTTISPSTRVRLPGFSRDIVWMIAGTNNIGYDNSGTVEDLLQQTETFFRELHAMGYTEKECYLTDILPRISDSERFEIERQIFNAEIPQRLKGLARVIPSGSNPSLQNPRDLNVYGDGIHPTPTGDQYLVEDALAAIRRNQ